MEKKPTNFMSGRPPVADNPIEGGVLRPRRHTRTTGRGTAMKTGIIKLTVAVAMVGMTTAAEAGPAGGFRPPGGGHYGGFGPVVRDHRTPPPPVVVRDHRIPPPPVVVRDHRTPPPPVVVRDHRIP